MPKISPTDAVASRIFDYWFQYCVTYSGTPGCQVCIRKAGNLVFNKAYGYADLDKKELYTTGHIGRLSSHSKILTACVMLRLQAEGALSLNDLASEHLPWLRRHPDKRVKQITLRDLLTHRAGLFGNGADGSYWELGKPFLSEKQIRDEVLRDKLVYAPNTDTKYSNIGYALLGMVAQNVTGLTYDQLVQKFILKKLRSLHLQTDYAQTNNNEKYAYGYSKKLYEGKSRAFKHVSTFGMAAAAGLCGNVENTTLLLHELYFGEKLLEANDQKELLNLCWPIKNSSTDSYGLGTAFNKTNCGLFVGHSGGFPGFTSQTRLWKGTDYIFGFISNTSESISLTAIKSIAHIYLKLQETFTKQEMPSLLVSAPMMHWWGASLYVVGKEKALWIPMNDWSIGEDAVVLLRRKDGLFESQSISGYSSVGEPVKIFIEGKKIAAVKFGAFLALPESEFSKRSKSALI